VRSTQAASDKVYQLLAHGRWFSPGTPASSTTKTGRHDIAEIFVKVTLNTINLLTIIFYRFWLLHLASSKFYLYITPTLYQVHLDSGRNEILKHVW
jgi:hypothetical protein